jgi:UDP-N-acetylmuramyl pentapeptide phosphotransferase/UDP-N-acetylglucosamine-1-phosphate transferase
MTVPIFTTITSFAIAFLILPVIIRYSYRKNLVDIPGRRKIHKKVTPTMGGIAIFFGFIISLMIWIEPGDLKVIRNVIISLLIIFVVGLRDDFLSLKPVMKLAVQIFVAVVLIIFFDLKIQSLYGLFDFYTLPSWLGYTITIFTIIVIVNSLNLIDGLDGLAGTISSIALFTYGVWFYLADDLLFSTISFAMLGGVVAFLRFNWEPSQIFMGDSGALVVGLVLAILTIHFINYNYSLPDSHLYRYEASVGTGISFIVVPLIDTLRVFIIRLSRRQSPFTPDKNHIHHTLMRLGLSHSETTLILGGVQALFIVLAILFRHTHDNYILPGIIAIGIVLSIVLDRAIRSKVQT